MVYYKCNTLTCQNNCTAKWLNEHFKKILGYFNLNISCDLLKLIRGQTIAAFDRFTSEHADEYHGIA